MLHPGRGTLRAPRQKAPRARVCPHPIAARALPTESEAPAPGPKRTRPGSTLNPALPRGEPGADKNVKRPGPKTNPALPRDEPGADAKSGGRRCPPKAAPPGVPRELARGRERPGHSSPTPGALGDLATAKSLAAPPPSPLPPPFVPLRAPLCVSLWIITACLCPPTGHPPRLTAFLLYSA